MNAENRRSLGFGGALLTSVAVAVCLIFVAWAKMETVQITYEIGKLVQREEKLSNDQRRLRAELAELRAPSHLEALAPELGLGAPKAGQVVVVTEDPEGLSAALSDQEGR